MGKIASLLPKKQKIVVSTDADGTQHTLEVRALTLPEMVELFYKNSQTFLGMYAAAQERTGSELDKFTAFLLGAPEIVYSILDYALDPDDAEDMEAIRGLAPTVQLIALDAAWSASVPDPKKAKELLSVVMAKLRMLSEKAKLKDQAEALLNKPLTPSTAGSVATLNSSVQTDTPLPPSEPIPSVSSTDSPTLSTPG